MTDIREQDIPGKTTEDKVFLEAAAAGGDFLGHLLSLKNLGVPKDELLALWYDYCRELAGLAGLPEESEKSEQKNK